jgi:hypothetical protein
VNLFKKIFGRQEKAVNDSTPENSLSSKEYKKNLAAAVFSLLKEKGFVREGMNFSLTGNDLAYFIQLQSSQSSSAEVWKFTLNIGIASLKLCKLTDIINPTYLDCHWKKRIGRDLTASTDKWWEFSDGKLYENAKEEVIKLLLNDVLPELFSFKRTEDLQQFWLQGHYQGLTKGQQEYYLKLLA